MICIDAVLVNQLKRMIQKLFWSFYSFTQLSQATISALSVSKLIFGGLLYNSFFALTCEITWKLKALYWFEIFRIFGKGRPGTYKSGTRLCFQNFKISEITKFLFNTLEASILVGYFITNFETFSQWISWFLTIHLTHL